MVNSMRQILIKEAQDQNAMLSGVIETGKYVVVEEFIEDMETGLEVMFEWRKHGYTVFRNNDKKFDIGEWYKDETDRIFDSVNELLDNYILATGEKLREVITQVRVKSIYHRTGRGGRSV